MVGSVEMELELYCTEIVFLGLQCEKMRHEDEIASGHTTMSILL